jgi:predicted Fe-Mo cluster-binding NifX family protein
LSKFRIAVATNGRRGLQDTVSEVFGKANTFTIIEIKAREIQTLKVIKNPALPYEHGAGPIAVKELVDLGVDLVIAPHLGHGASSILEHHGVSVLSVEAGTAVRTAVESALESEAEQGQGDDPNKI